MKLLWKEYRQNRLKAVRKKAEGTGTGQMRTYVDGNTVRRLQAGPKETTRNRMSASSATRKNRARALQMNLSYVVFLTVAAVALSYDVH